MGVGKELMCEGYKFYGMRFVGKVWLLVRFWV
jgi:hypothetical protein